MALPSSGITLFENMPRPQTQVESCLLAITVTGLLPSLGSTRSAFSANGRIILISTTIHISGLNTEPAFLIPSAPYFSVTRLAREVHYYPAG